MEELDYELSRTKVLETIKTIKKCHTPDLIKKGFTKILTILTYHQSIIHDIDINAIKHTGMQYAITEFLELLALSNPADYIFIFDLEIITIIVESIYAYLQNEYNNYLDTRKTDKDEDKENTSIVMTFENIDDNMSKSSDDKDGRVMSDECDEHEFYIDFIDDPTVNCVVEIFTKYFKESRNVYLLKLLHDNGFFNLISIIVTESICNIFQSIYKDKVYAKEQHILTHLAPTEPSSFIEIQRLLFDPHTIVKEKSYVDDYEIEKEDIIVDDIIYKILAEELFNRNLFFIISEIGICKIIHPILFLLEYKSDIMSRNTNELISHFYTDDIISDINESLFTDNNIYLLKFYNFLLKHLKEQEKKKILHCKLVLEPNIIIKLFKDFKKKSINYRKTLAILYYLLLKNIIFYEKHFIEESSVIEYIQNCSIVNELKYIIDLLNYRFEEKIYVVKLIKILYKYCDKVKFYKISYYIMYRYYVKQYDDTFASLLFYDIVNYHQMSIYNFPKILFNFKPVKETVEDNKDVGVNEFIEQKDDVDEFKLI